MGDMSEGKKHGQNPLNSTDHKPLQINFKISISVDDYRSQIFKKKP